MNDKIQNKLNTLAEFKFGKGFNQLNEDEQTIIFEVFDKINTENANARYISYVLPDLEELLKQVNTNQVRIEKIMTDESFFANRIQTQLNTLDEVTSQLYANISSFTNNIDYFAENVLNFNKSVNSISNLNMITTHFAKDVKECEKITDDIRYYVNEFDKLVEDIRR